MRWRALEAADLLCAELDRRIEDLETLSATVRDACHRLDGDGWQGLAYDAVLAHVDAAYRHHQVLCQHAERLREAGARALSDLHYTALALLDYVADAEAAGCRVADDWSVTAGETAQDWAEVITEAVAAVERADQRGRAAIAAVGTEITELAKAFDFPRLLLDGLGALLTGGPTPAAQDSGGPDRPGDTPTTDTGTPPPRPGEGPPTTDSTRVGSGPGGPDTGSTREGSVPGDPDTGSTRAGSVPGDPTTDSFAAGSGPGVLASGLGTAVTAGEYTEPTPALPGAANFTETHAAATGSATSAHDGQVGSVAPVPRGPIADAHQGEPDTGAVASIPVPQPLAVVEPPPGAITAEQLVAIMPDLPLDRAQEYLPALNTAMAEGQITTPPRQAAFLAQLAHESCQLRYFEELGDDDYFSQYDPGQPNTAAGNTEPGDGPRYHGRGPIQLTGRANYRAAGEALGLDLEGNPELAAAPDVGFRIAQWYWTSRDINALADMGDFAAVTQAVNGGYNGLAAREEYFRRALAVLG
ncbi:glycoside hydrolase family 19 protein [Nocardia wallacei]|uniref:glycoside hydrolase family 19 protein n=1 Tax=Nocardia wallacei TaxID=480035 RepID=UPI002453E4DF|nr:glycoside hydrolase family 19 protein [Nocardia wallacei]